MGNSKRGAGDHEGRVFGFFLALLFVSLAFCAGGPPEQPCIIESPGDVAAVIEEMNRRPDCERFIITRPELIP